jgi:hypothetical protein
VWGAIKLRRRCREQCLAFSGNLLAYSGGYDVAEFGCMLSSHASMIDRDDQIQAHHGVRVCVCPFWYKGSKNALDVRWLWTGPISAALESEIPPPLCCPWVIEGCRPHATVVNLAFQPWTLSPALTLERTIFMIALADLASGSFGNRKRPLI